MVKLAEQYGRYGYRRVTELLRRRGWNVNHKRIERLWRWEGLKVPQKQPKRRRLWLGDGSCVRLRPAYRDHVWSYDFVHHRTHDGRAFRMLTLINLAHNATRGMISTAKDGFLCGQVAPYGYDRMAVDTNGEHKSRIRNGEQVAKPKSWKVTLVPSDDPQKVEIVK